MEIRVRGIEPRESDALIRAVSAGFGGHIEGRDLELEKTVLEPGRALVAVDGETFVGGAAACSFELSIPGGRVPCAGITSVAVLPTHRRRGVLNTLMRRLLDDLRGREPVSALWASEGAIYGRYGYGMATLGSEIEITRPHTAFRPGYRPSGSMRLVTRDEAMKAFPPVYDRVAAGQPGFLSRPEPWWPYRFTIHDFLRDGFGEPFFAIHEGEEGVDGYVAYRIKHRWHEEVHHLQVRELMSATPGAYADLWRFCFDIDLVERFTAGTRAPVEPLVYLLADPNPMEVELRDGLWVRLVDLPAALEARAYEGEGRLVLDVSDAFCPWNEGRWELTCSPEGATCRRTDADPDVVLTVEELGAAYLGGVAFRTLGRAGRVEERSPGALARADSLFGWDPAPWCPMVF